MGPTNVAWPSVSASSPTPAHHHNPVYGQPRSFYHLLLTLFHQTKTHPKHPRRNERCLQKRNLQRSRRLSRRKQKRKNFPKNPRRLRQKLKRIPMLQNDPQPPIFSS